MQSSSSYHFQLVTLATVECADELALMHDSLRAFHSPQEVPVVVGCSSELLKYLENDNMGKYEALVNDPTIQWISCLDQYGKINRQKMEREKGVWYPTKHCDFMMEKANVMEYALLRMNSSSSSSSKDLSSENNKNDQKYSQNVLPSGVLYVDSDITFFNSLHSMFESEGKSTVKKDVVLGVSPHLISEFDERLFGRFNGGMMFAAHPVVLWHWKAATQTSRYFDQASIEDVYSQIRETEGEDSVCVFGPQVNYGFWRMFQTRNKSIDEEIKSGFSLSGNKGGILYQGKPLQSVHTHWFMPTGCREIPVFNKLLKKWIGEVRLANPSMYKGLLRIV